MCDATSSATDCYMHLSFQPRGNSESRTQRQLLADSLRNTLPPMQALPEFSRWHVTTQDRLIFHLHSLWADRAPRVMVDVGCHSAHGIHANVSDALLWLDAFGMSSPGGLVLGIDAYEDFALDLQRRFDTVHSIRNHSRSEQALPQLYA